MSKIDLSQRRMESGQTPSEQWKEHEHQAQPVEIQAKKLLQAAGSTEIAKHAVDTAAKSEQSSPNFKQESLAQRSGFSSYRALVEASSSVASKDARQWYVTPLRQNEWVLWNDHDLTIEGMYESSEEATAATRKFA